MVRYLSWLANAALFTLCCFLVADTANAVFAAVLAPTASTPAEAATRQAVARRSWADRQVILERNLFNSSLIAPPAPVEEVAEDLEPTKLPLTLHGTAACSHDDCSWAAIEIQTKRETSVFGPGDEILRTVSLVRVEPRRVVLSEGGAMRELVLDEENENAAPRRPPPAAARQANAARRAQARNDRLKRLADDRFSVPKSDVEEMVRNPATLFSQARILPKYEEGQMVGLQVNSIKNGSLFEEIGLRDGDVITELNGIAIESPEESAKILAEFSQAKEFSVVVESGGEVRELEFTMPEGE